MDTYQDLQIIFSLIRDLLRGHAQPALKNSKKKSVSAMVNTVRLITVSLSRAKHLATKLYWRTYDSFAFIKKPQKLVKRAFGGTT